MTDDASKQDFQIFLQKKNWSFETVILNGMAVFKISNYVIPHGKCAGKIVDIGLAIPNDFPSTAPYGMHIKSNHGITDNIVNRNPSGLGSDWEFWSRSIFSWTPGRRNSQYYIDNVNRWLELH
jgi:hypothetical protein